MKGTLVDKDGDAVMVTAVMLMALFLSVGSSYVLNYGEVVGKEDEMVHLSDIEASLMRVRNSMLKLVESEDTSSSIINRITLGTPGNPYIGTARSSGELRMVPDPSAFKLEVVLEGGATEPILNSVSGTLVYTSNNYYFNDQTYHFEAGGIFIDEYDFITGALMPSISIEPTSSGWGMSLQAYDLSSTAWTVSGIETLAVRINMAGFYTNRILQNAGQVVSIRISSTNEQGWAEGFREVMNMEGLVEGLDYSVDEPADWTDPADHLEIDLLTPGYFNIDIGQMEVTLI